MTNIAFVHSIFPAGGAERVTIDIAQYLSKFDKYKIYVFTTTENKSLYDNSLTEYITIIKISKKGRDRAKDIENLVNKLNINILVLVVNYIRHINDVWERTGIKLVYANHGEPFWQRYNIIAHRQNSFLKKILWKLFWNRIYLDSSGGKAMRMAIKRCFRIYSGCDTYTVLCESYKKQACSAFGISPEDSHIVAIENSERIRDKVNYAKENTVLFCGRLSREKRIDRVLRIWAMVQDRLNDWNLKIVGDGSDREYLEQLSATLKLKRISFEGEQKDVQKYYDKASILVLTSQTEGWGLCLTEAQASGVVPIAFACSAGVEEVINKSGECGFTVECFDEKKFADTLVNVASLPKENIDRIRHNAVAFRAKYSPEIIMEKWKNLFDSLL